MFPILADTTVDPNLLLVTAIGGVCTLVLQIVREIVAYLRDSRAAAKLDDVHGVALNANAAAAEVASKLEPSDPVAKMQAKSARADARQFKSEKP